MDCNTVEYNGKVYSRQSGKWTEASGCVAPSHLQNKLNQIVFDREVKANAHNPQLLTEVGDVYKEGASYGLAIQCYQLAIEVAQASPESYGLVRYILPRMTSCLRKQGRADEVVKMFSYVKEKYGADVMDHVLLTSIAAAFCDLRQYEKAGICCERALQLCGDRPTDALQSVLERISRETT